MTEIEELIEAAKKAKKKWRKPSGEPRPSYKNMQELMDTRLYKGNR